jgi:hypothetical protein
MSALVFSLSVTECPDLVISTFVKHRYCSKFVYIEVARAKMLAVSHRKGNLHACHVRQIAQITAFSCYRCLHDHVKSQFGATEAQCANDKLMLWSVEGDAALVQRNWEHGF